MHELRVMRVKWDGKRGHDFWRPMHRYDGRNILANRLKAGTYELCGSKTDDIRMHHARALKKLTGVTEAERLMLHMRRKSLALCPYCYHSTLAQEL